MKKRLLCALLALTMIASLATAASAAGEYKGGGLNNFKRYNSYSGSFKDISKSAWYHDYVVQMYEYGLVNGRTSTQFSPDGQMTLAEVITLAARIFNGCTEYGGVIPSSTPWYSSYVEYARGNDIIDSIPTTAQLSTPVTRAQAAEILGKCVPLMELKAINSIPAVIPDTSTNAYGHDNVKFEDPGYLQIRRLYAAGVLTGSDASFNFKGSELIKRSEVMGLACRIIDESQRVKFSMPGLTTSAGIGWTYWRDYNYSGTTLCLYLFRDDGTYEALTKVGTITRTTGTYSIKNGALSISGTGYTDLRYDEEFGIFIGSHNNAADLVPSSWAEYFSLASFYVAQ